MARLGDVVFDCRHAASLARFWAAAVDGYQVAPYDDEEIARLRSLGYDGPEDDPGVIVERADGGLPRLYFQQVPEPKPVTKNRLHLDLRTDDLTGEVGARAVWTEYDEGDVAGARAKVEAAGLTYVNSPHLADEVRRVRG